MLVSFPGAEPRRRRECRELPSWGPESPEGHDDRCRLELFSEFRRAEEESKDEEESVEVWRFDLGARPSFFTSSSPDSIHKYHSYYQLQFYILRKISNIQKNRYHSKPNLSHQSLSTLSSHSFASNFLKKFIPTEIIFLSYKFMMGSIFSTYMVRL